jgi:hypothetical protein
MDTVVEAMKIENTNKIQHQRRLPRMRGEFGAAALSGDESKV